MIRNVARVSRCQAKVPRGHRHRRKRDRDVSDCVTAPAGRARVRFLQVSVIWPAPLRRGFSLSAWSACRPRVVAASAPCATGSADGARRRQRAWDRRQSRAQVSADWILDFADTVRTNIMLAGRATSYIIDITTITWVLRP